MKHIQIYTKEDAERDIRRGKTGAWCSVQKWESILRALLAIQVEIVSPCGLCLTMKDTHVGCERCPLKKKGELQTCTPKMPGIWGSLAKTLIRTRKLLKQIGRIEGKEKSDWETLRKVQSGRS